MGFKKSARVNRKPKSKPKDDNIAEKKARCGAGCKCISRDPNGRMGSCA